MNKNIKIAVILTAMDRMSGVIGNAVNKANRHLKTMDKAAKSLDDFGNKALIAGGIGTVFFASTVKSAEESEVATSRLRQVFKSMGQDYNTATAQAEQYASALQTQIGQEDELIMAVQAKLATFNKAANAQARSNGIFNRATVAAFDMKAAGFGDAQVNIVQLGKALQDPIKGITALRKSGITFTEAEQKKIKVLVQSNKLFEAQNMVMKAIETQVGGVAASTVTQSQKMRIAWGEVSETIGKKLLPYFIQFGTYVSDVMIPAIIGFIDAHPNLVKWLAIASVSLLAIGAAAKVVSFGITGITTVFRVLGVTLRLVGGIITFVGRLFLANPILLIITAIAAGVYLIIKHWSKIKAFFTNLWKQVKSIFSSFFNWVKNVFLNYTPLGLIIKNWGVIKDWFSNLWQGIKDIASSVWDAIGDAIMWPINKIKKAWQDLKDWFSDLWSGIKDVAGDMLMGPAGVANGAMRRAAEAQAKAQQAANNITPAVTTNFINSPSPSPIPVRTGGTSSFNIAPVYNITATSEIDFERQLKKHSDVLSKTIQEADRKRGRLNFNN